MHRRIAEPSTAELNERLRELKHRVKNHLAPVLAMIRLEAGRVEKGNGPDATFDVLSRRVGTPGRDVGPPPPAVRARRARRAERADTEKRRQREVDLANRRPEAEDSVERPKRSRRRERDKGLHL